MSGCVLELERERKGKRRDVDSLSLSLLRRWIASHTSPCPPFLQCAKYGFVYPSLSMDRCAFFDGVYSIEGNMFLIQIKFPLGKNKVIKEEIMKSIKGPTPLLSHTPSALLALIGPFLNAILNY